MTLFTHYAKYVVSSNVNARSNANEYYSLKYRPVIRASDFTHEQKSKCTIEGETSPNSECLYDMKLLESEAVGSATLKNRVEFNELVKLLCKLCTFSSKTFHNGWPR